MLEDDQLKQFNSTPSKTIEKDLKSQLKFQQVVDFQLTTDEGANSNTITDATNYYMRKNCIPNSIDSQPFSLSVVKQNKSFEPNNLMAMHSAVLQSSVEQTESNHLHKPITLVYFLLSQKLCQGQLSNSDVLLVSTQTTTGDVHISTNTEDFIDYITQKSPIILFLFDSTQSQVFDRLVGHLTSIVITQRFQISWWLENYSGLSKLLQSLNRLVESRNYDCPVIEFWQVNSATQQRRTDYIKKVSQTLWDLFINHVWYYSNFMTTLVALSLPQITQMTGKQLATHFISVDSGTTSKTNHQSTQTSYMSQLGATSGSIGGLFGGEGKQIKHWNVKSMSVNALFYQSPASTVIWLGCVRVLYEHLLRLSELQLKAANSNQVEESLIYKSHRRSMKQLLNSFVVLMGSPSSVNYDPNCFQQILLTTRQVIASAQRFFESTQTVKWVQFDTDSIWVEQLTSQTDQGQELNQFVQETLKQLNQSNSLKDSQVDRIEFIDDGPYDMMLIPSCRQKKSRGQTKSQNEVSHGHQNSKKGLIKQYCVMKDSKVVMLVGVSKINSSIIGVEWITELTNQVAVSGCIQVEEVRVLWNKLESALKNKFSFDTMRKLGHGYKEQKTTNEIAISYLNAVGILNNTGYMIQLRPLKGQSKGVGSRLFPIDMFIEGLCGQSTEAKHFVAKLSEQYQCQLSTISDLKDLVDWKFILRRIKQQWVNWVGEF